jgi:hypothetical protein
MNLKTTIRMALGFLAFGCTLLCVRVELCAQSTFGSIRGSALDQSGAVLPQTQIMLHNVGENTDVATVSDGAENFLFADVKPCNYRVTGAKEGFANSIVDKVELTARQEICLDQKFALAAANQQVTLTEEAVAVNTENATLSDSNQNSDITQLPINSRAVPSSPLAALAACPSVSKDSQGNIAVGGATSSQTGFWWMESRPLTCA